MGSGQFPSRPRGRGKGYYNVILKKDDLEEGEIEEDDVESDPEEDDSDSKEELEEESTDDDDKDYNHLCNGKEGIEILHAYVLSCFTKMFNVIMKHREEAFLEINGQRFLHPYNFDNMLD